MNSNRWKIASIVGAASMFCLFTACDKQTPEKASSSASTGKTDDRQALAEFLNKDTKKPPMTVMPQGHPPVGGAPAPSTDSGLPSGHPPIGGAPPAPPSGPELKYDVPADWERTPVKSAMRKAQFRIPGASADKDGEMIVFFFGAGQGGPTEANLARWRSFFTTPDGKPVPDDSVVTDRFEAGDIKVTTIDLAGLYNDTTMNPGATPSTDIKRLLGAVVETPGGNWFFKGVGPPDTMGTHREKFLELLRSVKQ